MKGAQVGGTEIGNNWIGYIIDYAPGPTLLIQPTVEMAKRNSKQRLDPLIEECPRLCEKIKDKKAKDSGNTILGKDFPGGVLVMTGANSAVGLRSLPARYLFMDEVDGYPGDVDGEGDPVNLATARSRTFSRRKIFKVSTPAIAGKSRIEFDYERSDQRKYFVPCPFCGEMQTIEWKRIIFKKDAPPHLECISCKGKIEEHHKTTMLKNGKWIAQNPESKIAGFHLSSLYSPLGWFSWEDAFNEWEECKKNPEKLKYFVNTVLGETWKEKGDAPDWEEIYNKREKYKLGELPPEALFITCGVDIQKDRIEAETVAWGQDKQSWSIDYNIFYGSTETDEPWKELDKLLNTMYRHETGCELPILKTAIDSGYNTQYVYNFCRKYSINKVMAIKGVETCRTMVSMPRDVDIDYRGKKIRRGIKLWNVGISIIKSELYGFLRLKKNIEKEYYPGGYCHFPEYGPEYFKMLTAEHLVVKMKKGYRKYEWEKIRERNEALDCRVYARAAANVVGLDRFNETQWNEFKKTIWIQDQDKKDVKIKRKKPSSFW